MIALLSIQTPIVIMHGFMDHKDTLLHLKHKIENAFPDRKVINCEVGNGQISSIVTPINQQVSELRTCIMDDEDTKNGFYAIGHSQGSYLFRQYIELHQHDSPPVIKYFSLAGPLGGQFCGRKSKCFHVSFPWFINNYIENHVYKDSWQNGIGASNYWRDPYQLEVYQERSTSLAILDNIREYSQQRKENFMSVAQIVLFGGPNDGIITPWQSTFFGVFKENKDKDVVEYQDRPEYKEDTFGLRSMVEQGRIEFVQTDLDHLSYVLNNNFIENILIPRLK
ncbi:Palmitoyl-protein thioesterase [Spironucleus salmonicida]|uniref:palmitoyl-CoA hydrolase n=1 Tax=Spironucleus salmonicida TaxID=348837 RepID=V6LQ13_9EUKA|nr:Palmitoyl-protein thioesterase [Spironucleus salmonicida]|eukprot:EST46762.1 Palmitoyl-protein thioesterase [Spironucleus salmonicida]